MTNTGAPTDIAILLLAAGSSSRMGGRDKLLEKVDGQPLLQMICTRALDSGLPVFVTLPAPDHPRAQLVAGCTPVWVPDAAEGMAASVRRGIGSLPDTTRAVMILPSDMPDLQTEDFCIIANALGDEIRIIRGATDDGRPGHPVLFPKAHFADLQKATGDEGGRSIIKAHKDLVTLVRLDGVRALTDLDTPEAWATWRANQR